MFRKVAVGISGGVDSAVSALLLKEKGFEVVGVFMKNWEETEEKGHCSGEQDWIDAKMVCNKLNIPLKQVNFVKEYWNYVFWHFLDEYQLGLTPNPDILCNKFIKFGNFFNYAKNILKVDAIATGHYAQTSFGPYLEKYNENENVKLLQAEDSFKDQTFFLSNISEKALRYSMFPVGVFRKSEVKSIAMNFGLGKIAQKCESTGICFIGNRNFKDFISEYIPKDPGNFIDIDTKSVVGKHNGIHEWTIGQRCRISGCIKPYFIAKKDLSTKAIYVAPGSDHPSLYSRFVYISEPYWISENKYLPTKLRCKFRFQHTKPLICCNLIKQNDKWIVELDEYLRAVTPGQYAVFYLGRECLGSAKIQNSLTKLDEEKINFFKNKNKNQKIINQ